MWIPMATPSPPFRRSKRTACSPCCLPEGKRIPFERFYAAVPQVSSLAVIGSSGFVEIAINQGNAARELGLRTGSEVIIGFEV